MGYKIKKMTDNKLKLKNDGRLSVFFMGVGSAFSKINNQTNFIIIKGDDHVMIDCGTKTPQALFNIGHSVMDIDKWLITHSHADHIGGLEEVTLMNKFVKGTKTNIIITRKYKKMLWDYSLKGGSGFNSRTKDGKFVDMYFYINSIYPKKITKYKRDTYEYNVGNINVKMIRTKHIPDNSKSWKDSVWSTGLLIDERILFTCDMRYDKDFIDFCEKHWKIDYIFHDCQFFPGGVHAPLEELKQLPLKIKKKIFLVHYGDNFKDFKPEDDGFIGFGHQMVYYYFD